MPVQALIDTAPACTERSSSALAVPPSGCFLQWLAPDVRELLGLLLAAEAEFSSCFRPSYS